MSLTTIIENWNNLPSFPRGVYSVLIGLTIYLLFRWFIYKMNQIAPKPQEKKERGNYWERLKKQASWESQN